MNQKKKIRKQTNERTNKFLVTDNERHMQCLERKIIYSKQRKLFIYLREKIEEKY